MLRALSQLLLKPLASVDMKELSLKSALLLALTSAKRIGDLHVFSVDSDCIRFGPGDCGFTLRPRPGYVPNHYLPRKENKKKLQTADCFTVCPVFWIIDLTWCGRSDFGVPRQGFEDLHQPFGQLSAIWPAFRVLWWLCEGPGRNKTEAFPLDCGHYHGCLYEPRFGMPVSH